MSDSLPKPTRARYVPYAGAWSLFHLEFDPPMILPAHKAARYKTPPLPTSDPADGPGPWFPVEVTFEDSRHSHSVKLLDVVPDGVSHRVE